MNDENPYQTPNSVDRKIKRHPGRPSRWFFTFLVNLPIPLLFGMGLTEGEAQSGAIIGLAILVGIGWRICLSYPDFTNCFCLGSLVVAASQFFPILHILAGTIGVYSVGILSPTLDLYAFEEADLWITALHDGLFVALITGGQLLLLAILLGLFFRFIWPGYGKPNYRRKLPKKLPPPRQYSGPDPDEFWP